MKVIKIFLICLFLFLPLLVTAKENLIVNFNPDPLFSTTNFAPGDSLSGFVKVENNSGQTKKIVIEAINILDTESLSDIFNLQIKQESDILFENSLNVFLKSGEIFLSSLEDRFSNIYEFIISFDSKSGNELQGKKLENFDLLIGFLGEEKVLVVANNSNGGAGGVFEDMPSDEVLQDLIISQQIETLVQNDQVTITWLTNHKSTSRVIYSIAGETHLFDFNNPPKYGYFHSTLEQDTPANINGVTFHKVVLKDLVPGTEYYYRVVSHASPDTISQEYSFITKSFEIENLKEGIEIGRKEMLENIEDEKQLEQDFLLARMKSEEFKQIYPTDAGQVAGEKIEQSTDNAPDSLKKIFHPFFWWFIIFLTILITVVICVFKLRRKNIE